MILLLKQLIAKIYVIQEIDAMFPDSLESESDQHIICVYNDTNTSFPSKKHNPTFSDFLLILNSLASLLPL